MKTGPQKFIGFRGICCAFQIGPVKYFLMARTVGQLEAVYRQMKTSEPFDPAICTKGILVEARLLSVRKAKSKKLKLSEVIDVPINN